MKRVAVILVLVLVVSVGAWSLLPSPVRVEVAAARRSDAAEVVYATGVVEPVIWAQVTPLVQARITELSGCEGQEVAAGDVLARLDAGEAEAVLAELLARQNYLQRERDRLRDLVARNIGTRAELERAESEEEQIEAAIAGQRARLENHVHRAPTDGVILRQEGDVGEIAAPGEVFYWVGQTWPLRVLADINEEDIPRIEPGQRTLLAADVFPERQLEAEVASVTPMGDPVSRTYRVRFSLPEGSPLMIGMSVEVNVIVSEKSGVLLVPAGAVDAEGAVWVVEEVRIRRRPVTLGIRGAREGRGRRRPGGGAIIVVPAPVDLEDGVRVEVVE